ncbi:MAG TPA: hypothetical protein VFE47_21545 [Tepidisphaeraceae bacterium]|jgi:hypothetical protein|nr:hypothetical protein [Tepidisphaeraceae bacterium]
MKNSHIGKLPPRYTFLLNPHPESRLTKCPKCGKLTYPRKFPLFTSVVGWGPLTIGKTCKYCPRCEQIMCNQNDFDEVLTEMFRKLRPEVIGNEYMVLGTVTPKMWKSALAGKTIALEEMLENVADFKRILTLDIDPGGWRRPGDDERWIIKHADAERRRKTPWTEYGKSAKPPLQ